MAYEEALRRQLLGLPEFRTDQPCELRMLFVQQPFKTVDRSVSRMDLDNLSKLPMDTMTKCEDETGTRRYWLDDSLIVSLVALKRFAAPGEESHTKVRIIPVEDVSAHVDRLFWS
jgi:Holliday junction resolvase RusA-like endonuclease